MKRIFIAWASMLSLLAGCATPSQMAVDAKVKELCAKDGGIKVYETVTVDPGTPIRVLTKKYAKAGDEFYYEWDYQFLKEGRPERGETDLTRSHFRLYRAKDRKLLGESVSYTRRGGDFPGPSHLSHFSCPDESGPRALEKNVFLSK